MLLEQCVHCRMKEHVVLIVNNCWLICIIDKKLRTLPNENYNLFFLYLIYVQVLLYSQHIYLYCKI